MIHVTPEIKLDDNELRFDFVRSGGPGGQNVNKVSTAAQLRFDVKGSANLKPGVRERIMKLAGQKMTRDGVLVIHANTYRSQEKNRDDAIRRLSDLIREASRVPKRRGKTKPTLASKTKRLESKKKRSRVKEMRRSVLTSRD